LDRQTKALDAAKRRDLIHDMQRHLARQQYYVELPCDRLQPSLGSRIQ
jgi:hypothetical protein